MLIPMSQQMESAKLMEVLIPFMAGIKPKDVILCKEASQQINLPVFVLMPATGAPIEVVYSEKQIIKNI